MRAGTQELECLLWEDPKRPGTRCWSHVTRLQPVHIISHSAAVRAAIFASFAHFRVRSRTVSLWLLQVILTYVHKKLRSINQCPVTSCREAISSKRRKCCFISRQRELALIFKTLSQVKDAAVFLERRGNRQSPRARSNVSWCQLPTSEYFYQNTSDTEAWPKSSALAEAGMASGNKIWLEAINKASGSLPVHWDLESKAVLSNCLNTIQSCCPIGASQIPQCPVRHKGWQSKPELELRAAPSLDTVLACGASFHHHHLGIEWWVEGGSLAVASGEFCDRIRRPQTSSWEAEGFSLHLSVFLLY